jgi:hypothetical protein
MPRSLAIGAVKLTVLTTAPTVPGALSLATDLTGAKDVSDNILKSSYTLGATGADKVNEPSLAATTNSSVPGMSNYNADIEFFRYLDEEGKSVPTEDVPFTLFTGKGIRVWLVERKGPPSKTDLAAADVVDVYEVLTDDPRPPKDYASYLKFGQLFHVQNVWNRVVIAA